MASWTQRIANVNITVNLPNSSYSASGAKFQEDATKFITNENKASNPIGRLVTAINSCMITVKEANEEFNSWLGYKAL